MPASPSHVSATPFRGESEMARRMREFDWAATSLGPVERWPPSLRTSVNTCLQSAFPFVVWWGADMITFYNDEYQSVLGAKHPAALGARAPAVWSEIWDVIGPMLARVTEYGETTRSRDLRLQIERSGYREEAYFSFSCSPIHDENGAVGGVFCPVIETTDKVIGERRLRTLRDLAAKCQGSTTEQAACETAASVLAENPYDVPFTAIYLVEPGQAVAWLAATAGIAPSTAVSPDIIALNGDDACSWPLGEVARTGSPGLITDLAVRFGAVPTGAWHEAPRGAVIIPAPLPGQERARAIIVAAISPMRPFDDHYHTFVELIGSQLAAALAEARALEEGRARAEALAEIDRAKTAFFSNVSHEFRTPLTLMLGPLEDALGDNNDPVQPPHRERLMIAHRNSLRLLKLVNALLDFSRIEAGRIQASYEPIDVATLTADVASSFRAACQRAGLLLVIDCRPLDAVGDNAAYVDREMWEKIVLNLLSNAFKFTLEGTISVSLRVEGGNAVLRVSDTGSGIPAEALPRLFDRFYRVEGAAGRAGEGSGIGLSLVYEFAKLHGGMARAESTHGAGSRFTVTIPLGRAHLPQDRIGALRPPIASPIASVPFIAEAVSAVPVAAAPGQARVSGPRPRVVWADDNADMRAYVQRLLEPLYEVVAVPDGAAALSAMRDELPELVLSDIMMPRMDGVELLRHLRDDPRTRDVPVILLSARAGEESRVGGLELGADDYLIKPFTARELLARVGSHISLARIRREVNKALRLSEERFRSYFELGLIGMAITSPTTGCLAVNDRMCEMLGYDREEMLDASWMDLTHPADVAADFTLFNQVLAGEIDGYSIDKRWIHKDGRVIDSTISVKCVRHADGAVNYFVALAQDVTERKRAEAALRASEEQYRSLISQVKDYAIFATDERGVVTTWNEGCERVLGYSADEFVGLDSARLFTPEDRTADAPRTLLRHAAESGTARYDRWMLGKDGRRFFAMGAAAGIRDDSGDPIGFSTVMRDVTQMKLSQDELAQHGESLKRLVTERTDELEKATERLRMSERMASIGTLSAGLGHDMGNLLLPLDVRLQILLKAGLPAELHEHVLGIETCAKYLQRLSNGLRLLAVDPFVVRTNESTELHSWLDDVGTMMKNVLPPGARFEHDLPVRECWVTLGRISLTQAVFNVVQNAADSMRGRGWGRVTLECDVDYAEELVTIRITDDGPGMSEEVVRRCMEPYFSTKARGVSTGMGLAFVHGLVAGVGGRVDITSTVAQGTTVRLILPRALHDGSAERGVRLVATVEMADARLGSFITAELRALGLEVRRRLEFDADLCLRVVDGETLVQLVRDSDLFDARIVLVGALPADIDAGAAGDIIILGEDAEPEAIVGALRRVIDTQHAVRAR